MKKIALLVQDLDSDYFNYMVEGARTFCNQNDYQLLIFIVRGKNWQHGSFDYQYYAAIKFVNENNVDGILLAANTYLQYVEREKWEENLRSFNRLPFVSIGVSFPGIAGVVSENKIAFKKLMEHLYSEHGRRRFALVIPKTTSTDVLCRKAAFQEFVNEKPGLAEDSRIIETIDYTYEEAYTEISEICRKQQVDFDALVTSSDDLAFGCMTALKESGIDVPGQVSVTGFDNQKRCEFSEPPLTSIDQQLEKQSYQAACILASKIEGKFNGGNEIIVSSIPIFRKSCGCSTYRMCRNLLNDQMLLLKHKEIIAHFHFFLQEMQASLSITEFKRTLTQYLKDYDVKACMICLYNTPVSYKRDEDFNLPESANVLIAYNEEGEQLAGREVCPAKELIPSDFKFAKDKEIVVSSIFNTEFQYGYIAYNPGQVDSRMYELIFSATGIALASNRALTLIDHEKVTDAMTGVLNRGGLMTRGQEFINTVVKNGEGGAVIFGDMDHLKKINDELGHEFGDEAIKMEVAILKKEFRGSDIIGRLGGDEFAIIAAGISAESFEALKIRIQKYSDELNATSGKPFQVSISLGAAYFDDSHKDLSTLLKSADEKQYEEKRRRHAER